MDLFDKSDFKSFLQEKKNVVQKELMNSISQLEYGTLLRSKKNIKCCALRKVLLFIEIEKLDELERTKIELNVLTNEARGFAELHSSMLNYLFDYNI